MNRILNFVCLIYNFSFRVEKDIFWSRERLTGSLETCQNNVHSLPSIGIIANNNKLFFGNINEEKFELFRINGFRNSFSIKSSIILHDFGTYTMLEAKSRVEGFWQVIIILSISIPVIICFANLMIGNPFRYSYLFISLAIYTLIVISFYYEVFRIKSTLNDLFIDPIKN